MNNHLCVKGSITPRQEDAKPKMKSSLVLDVKQTQNSQGTG
jgi:hypothetical protein